ncbi:hypothetical protein GGF37_006329, partial [Kickxella alabastrina]
MAGYLFLRSQYSLLSSWQRRWFCVSSGQLTHFQRDTPRDRESIPLHLCLARAGSGAAAALDRRHVFELVAPNRTYILQAESAHDLLAWHSCLRQAIEASLYAHAPAHLAVTRTASQPIGSGGGGGRGSPPIPRGSLPPASEGAPGAAPDSRDAQQRQRMAELAGVDGNDQCVDCGGPSPEWAATTVGALLCIECSGIHRSLGVHVSKVRSVKLDNWEPELLHIMRRLGNRRVNLIYEARRPSLDEPRRPRAASARGDRQPFIMQKYANRLFVGSALQAGAEPGPELLEAARSGDLPRALRALAQGANANAFDSATGATPLVEAVGAGDFGMLELLLLWGADPNQRARMTATSYDGSPGRSMGGTPLHWAARLGNVRVVWYLVRRGAQWDTPDAYGMLPLDIALEKSDVAVVMALRYAAFQKMSGLSPGSVAGAGRRGGAVGVPMGGGNAAAEPVDMLDMDDSFISEWVVPPYAHDEGGQAEEGGDEGRGEGEGEGDGAK